MKIKRKPLNLRRVIESLKIHLKQTRLTADIVHPPYTVDEEAEAKFNATDLVSKLASAHPDNPTRSNRVRLLTIIFLYQMMVSGTLNWLIELRKNPPKPTPPQPPDEPNLENPQAAVEDVGIPYEEALARAGVTVAEPVIAPNAGDSN